MSGECCALIHVLWLLCESGMWGQEKREIGVKAVTDVQAKRCPRLGGRAVKNGQKLMKLEYGL